ncbi:hypothetical protein L1887_30957 [Cichorium endivia]|nr:hypothetical protein L1887_30957 [Cichorium endivia]
MVASTTRKKKSRSSVRLGDLNFEEKRREVCGTVSNVSILELKVQCYKCSSRTIPNFLNLKWVVPNFCDTEAGILAFGDLVLQFEKLHLSSMADISGFNELPTRLSCYVLNEFSAGNIKITKESIRDILGVPCGGKTIVTQVRCMRTHPVTEFWNKQFEKQKTNKPNVNSIGSAAVLQEIKGGKDIRDEDGKKLFVLNFLVLFATCFVEGNQRGSCNTKFLHNISNIDDVSKLDWCGYIFECLCKADKIWCEGKGLYFYGSVSTLILHYLDSKCASVGVTRKGLEWTTDTLKTEDKNLNISKEELNEKSDGEKNPKKLKPTEEGIANSLNLKYTKFVSSKQELEEELELCSQQYPENETYIEIKKKMQIYRDVESPRKASGEDVMTSTKTLLLKNAKTLNGDTICVGPFHVRTKNAPSVEDMRLLEWIFNKQAKGIEGEIATRTIVAYNLEYRTHVEKQEMYTLYPKAWLSMYIVNFVVDMLCAKELKNGDLERWYFPLNLTGEEGNIQKQRLLHVEDSKNVQSVKSNHYFLIVVNTQEEKVEVWDTLKGPVTKYKEEFNNVCTFLDDYINPQKSFFLYTKNVVDIPKQQDAHDCGIYLCYYLEFPDDVHKFQKKKVPSTHNWIWSLMPMVLLNPCSVGATFDDSFPSVCFSGKTVLGEASCWIILEF